MILELQGRLLLLLSPQASVLETRSLFAAGNALSSSSQPMNLDTQMTLVLLQERLMVLRANDCDGYKS
ncbi:MAG: hypothetical protein QNL52_04780 [Synechococcus sp. ChBW.bin.23]